MPLERGRTAATKGDEVLFSLLSACNNGITGSHQWYIMYIHILYVSSYIIIVEKTVVQKQV